MGRPTTKPGTDFGLRLAKARKEAGLTQTQFGRLVGLTQKMVDYYERRSPNPTTGFVQKAAQALHLTVDELLGAHPPKRGRPGPTSKLERQLQEIRKLPAAKQKFLSELLDSVLRRPGA